MVKVNQLYIENSKSFGNTVKVLSLAHNREVVYCNVYGIAHDRIGAEIFRAEEIEFEKTFRPLTVSR